MSEFQADLSQPDLLATELIAMQYGMRPSAQDQRNFKTGWNLKAYGQLFEQVNEDWLKEHLQRGFTRFASAVKSGRSAGSLGHDLIERRPTKGRYVVFSDHHLNHGGNRQNFMHDSGNMALYVEVLAQYLDGDFTVVENGDLEDLLVVEPESSQLETRLGMMSMQLIKAPFGYDPSGEQRILANDQWEVDKGSWTLLNKHRHDVRLASLYAILRDSGNAEYYRIVSELVERDRFVRIVGNHDYDLQKPEFHQAMQSAIPNLPVPVDYLFLDDDGAPNGTQVKFAVMHGHQFDPVCLPESAPMMGELFSECLSWAYQGSDRQWPWDGPGWAKGCEWAQARKPFLNVLVTNVVSPWSKVSAAEIGSVLQTAVTEGLGDAISQALGLAFEHLGDQAGWEHVFGHNIAWNYFRNAAKPTAAIAQEVATGESFFKFRHLDELFIQRSLVQHFPDSAIRPKLLLGHSHEVRFHPAYLDVGTHIDPEIKVFEHYLNSGAAGRFQNLIWAIEIVDGVETLVSWSRPTVGIGKPERRVYRNERREGGSAQDLWASEQPIPLVAKLPQPVWLEAALHAAMA